MTDENSNLLLAAEQGHLEVIEKFIKLMPEVSRIRDSIGRTALHYAVDGGGNTNIIQLLINTDQSIIDIIDQDGIAASTLAILHNNQSALRLLIVNGASVNQIDNAKRTLLHWAVACDHLEMAASLLSDTACLPSLPDLYEARAIHYATQLDRTEILALLIDSELIGIDCTDFEGRTPLHWAASSGHVRACELLLSAGAKLTAPDYCGLTALHCAASRGHLAVCQLLITHDSKSINQHRQSISLADQRDQGGATSLCYAASLGHVPCCRLLMKHSDVNAQDHKYRSAAHYAAARAQLAVLKCLHQHGASLLLENHRGDLPIHEAAQTGCAAIVEWMLLIDATMLSLTNHRGRTALHLAAANGSLDICRLYGDARADLNPLMIIKNDLAAPLDLAISQQHLPVINFLRRHGAQTATEMSPKRVAQTRLVLMDQVVAHNQIQNSQGTSTDQSTDSAFVSGTVSRTKISYRDNETQFQSINSSNNRDQSTDANVLMNDQINQTTNEVSTNTENHIGVNTDAPAEHNSVGVETVETTPEKVTQDILTGKLSEDQTETDNQQSKGSKSSKKTSKSKKTTTKTTKRTTKSLKNSNVANSNLDSSQNQFLIKNGAAGRYFQQSRIFEELSNLKRAQLRYGKVQQAVITRKLMENFMIDHNIDPKQFSFVTYAAWEKYLYEQLRLVYECERERQVRSIAAKQRALRLHNAFDQRLLLKSPQTRNSNNYLIRMYGAVENKGHLVVD